MANRGRRRNSKGRGFLLLLIMMALTVAVGFFYASGRDSSKKDVESNKQKVQGINLDLREKAKNVQRSLDGILLAKSGWQLSDEGSCEHEEERSDKKGSILWTERKLLVGVPSSEDLEAAASWITGKVKAENLFVITRKNTTYEGSKAIVMEIAIYGKAGDQEVTCVTDKLTIYSKKPTTESKAGKKLKGNLAVIVDDCGYDIAPVRQLAELPIKMTFAVLPFKGNSTAALDVALSNGKEAILHLPMEPFDSSAASEIKMITVDMTKEDVQIYTRKAIASLSGISGVNNHQGSRATSNASTMQAVLEVLNNEGLYFVDSNTYAKSVGNKVAEEMGVPTTRNQKFLDNSSDVEEIKKSIWAAAEMAGKNGSAVVICHARPNTAKAWTEVYKQVQDRGIKFVSASNLLY